VYSDTRLDVGKVKKRRVDERDEGESSWPQSECRPIQRRRDETLVVVSSTAAWDVRIEGCAIVDIQRRHLIGQSQGKEALSLVSVTVATTFLIGWAFSQPFSERLGPKSHNIFCVLKFYPGCLELKVLLCQKHWQLLKRRTYMTEIATF
jgi:hypothetical protein